mgnify:CR=1 FL=1
MLRLAEEKEQDLQKIKLQLVAKNKNDLKEMERKLEDELEKEKIVEDERFEKKKQKMIKEMKV